MIVFMAHQLGHKVSNAAAGAGGAAAFRPSPRPGWSERWRLVSRVHLTAVMATLR